MTSTLVYDADCAFCTRCADFAAARGCEVAPWQALDLAAVGLTEADVTTAAYWLPSSGRPLRGARAVAAALLTMGPLYRVLGRIVDFPLLRPLGAVVYAVVAANRHRLPGGTTACRVP